jgi:hypothetical protein
MNYIPDYPIVGIDRILNFVQDRNCPYWVLYDSDKTSTASSQGRKVIADNLRFDEETVENGVRRLKITLDDYSETGFVAYLWCKEKAGSTSGGYYTGIKLTSNVNGVAGIGAIQQQTPVDIQGEIAKAIEAYQLKQKLEQLEKENKELKSEIHKETAFDRVIGRLEPYSEVIIKSIFTPNKTAVPVNKMLPANIAGEKDPVSEKKGDDVATDIAMKSLQVLASDDDEFHLKLQKLAELKENNPEMYETAINMLNTF